MYWVVGKKKFLLEEKCWMKFDVRIEKRVTVSADPPIDQMFLQSVSCNGSIRHGMYAHTRCLLHDFGSLGRPQQTGYNETHSQKREE